MKEILFVVDAESFRYTLVRSHRFGGQEEDVATVTEFCHIESGAHRVLRVLLSQFPSHFYFHLLQDSAGESTINQSTNQSFSLQVQTYLTFEQFWKVLGNWRLK